MSSFVYRAGAIASRSLGTLSQPRACDYTSVVTADQFALLETGGGSVLAAAMSLGAQTPDHYALLTASDGGADKVGGPTGDLDVAFVSPLFQQASTNLGINVIEMDGTTDAVGADNGTDWDVGDESMTLLYIGDGTKLMSSGRILCGKGSSTSGYAIRAAVTGKMLGYIYSAGGTKSAEVKHNHYIAQTRGALIAVMLRGDRNADIMQMYTSLGESAAATANTGTCTHTEPFKVGYSAGISAGAQHQGALAALWKGSNGEGITRQHFENLLEYLGLGIFNDVL